MDQWATDYAIIDRGQVLEFGKNPGLGNASVATHFELKFESAVAREQLESVLKNAGLAPSQITAKGKSLADIYRSIIQ
jgi:ABC-2 type transport system ATP-binding protein